MNLVIANTLVRQDESGRYLLNDLHRAAGAHNRHRPSLWLGTKQAKEFVAELEKAGIPAIQSKQQVGTFGCRELVYAYAMWISASFQLMVIRAFDTLVVEKKGVLAIAVENGHLKDQVRARDEIIKLKDGAIMGLQGKLIGVQDKQIRLIGQMAAIEKRQRIRETIQTIERMVLQGHSRDEIALATGKSLNYIRQYVFRLRKAGRLPQEGGEA